MDYKKIHEGPMLEGYTENMQQFDIKGKPLQTEVIGRTQEEVDMMSTYTHPAIVAAVYQQCKDFFQ